MTEAPTTVEQGEDDFLFVLDPGMYWFVLRNKWWTKYRRILQYVWGDAFRTFATREKTVPLKQGDFGASTKRKVTATWVVLEVFEPMMVSASIMGSPHQWEEGDSAQSVGAFETPEPHWIAGASAFSESVQEWAEEAGAALVEKGSQWAETSAEVGAKLAEFVTNPGQTFIDPFVKPAVNKAWAIGLIVVGVGAATATVYYLAKD